MIVVKAELIVDDFTWMTALYILESLEILLWLDIIFSKTTIEASTNIPIEIEIPERENRFIEWFKLFKHINVNKIHKGIRKERIIEIVLLRKK